MRDFSLSLKSTLIVSATAAVLGASGFGAYHSIARHRDHRVMQELTIAAYHDLLDPDSGKVREIKLYRQDLDGVHVTALCGELNAKNRMNAYVGFEPFVSFKMELPHHTAVKSYVYSDTDEQSLNSFFEK